MKPTPIDAVTWYKDESTYLRFKDLCVDKWQFPPTYADWLRCAEEGAKKAEMQGIVLRKVEYSPDEFISWCQVHSRNPDGKARAKFAVIKTMEQLDV